MLGLTSLSFRPQILPISIPLPLLPHSNLMFHCSLLKSQTQIPKNPSRFVLNSSGNGDNDLNQEPKIAEEEEENGSNGGGGDLKKDRRPIFNIKWSDLLDPDPENILAVGLTGLLTWASVQVLWQLFFISLAILLAALKYSFIAALLIFILITLL